MYDLPGLIWILVGVGAVGMPVVVGAALYRGARVSGARRPASALAGVLGTGALLGWVSAAAVLAARGFFRLSPGGVVPIAVVIDLGVIAALLLASRLPLIHRSVADPRAPARLAVPHTLRVLGIVFLVVAAMGRIPPLFAVPAGLGDLAIGVAAPFVAAGIARRGAGWTGLWRFNLLGIVDLVVAVTMAVLATRLGVTPSVAPLRLLPLAVIPTALVPLAVALHLVSLDLARRWRSQESRAGTRTGRVVVSGVE